MKVLLVVMVLCQLLLSDAMASIQSRTADGPLKEKGDDSVGLSANHDTELHQAYTRSRRSVANNPTGSCYKRFFVDKKPPRGFRRQQYFSPGPIKYICQQVGNKYFYATMFDEDYGIPIYAGYLVPKGHKGFGNVPRAVKWSQDPDIKRQGSNKMYQGSSKYGIHKGHLVPAQTYSFDQLSMASTFRYTNAVPQYKAFNIGSWKAFENRVRKYANHCAKESGDLYLLTGISEVQLVNIEKWQFNNEEKLHRFPNDDKSSIVIPKSMWTAGCCVYNGKHKSKVLGAFAAIGNNVNIKEPTKSVTVADLQDILKIGLGKKIELFPGNHRCALPVNQNDIQVYKNKG